MFDFAVFADDISQDLAHALDVVQELGLEWVEIRSAWGKNLVFQQEEEVHRVETMLRDRGLRVPSIAAPIFKSRLHGRGQSSQQLFNAEERDDLADQLALIRKAVHIARLFETNRVRCFSFWKTGDDVQTLWPELLAAFEPAVEIAEEEDIVLVLENDFECNLGGGAETARFIREVNSSHLRLLWDCGNAYFVGETPYPDGYEQARDVLGHVHIKDAVWNPQTNEPQWVELGTGQVDILGQLRALRADGYTDVISIENHFWPDGDHEAGVRRSFSGLQRLLGER